MAAEDDGKSEQPTGRKLSQARDEGNFAQSQEVKTAAMILAITVVVWLMAPFFMGKFERIFLPFLERPHSIRVGTLAELSTLFGNLVSDLAVVMAVPLIFLALVGFAAAAVQTGWIVSTNKLVPDLTKLNPVAGLGRMFSLQAVVELAKSILKLCVVGLICYAILVPKLKVLESLPTIALGAVLSYVHHVLIQLLFGIVLAMVVIALLDWFYQRYAFTQRMRMTRQEVKDEQKQTEGDPMVKARLRSLRLTRARQRMMAAVPKADVVVTNPTHYACALAYKAETMNAPVLVAKGQNLVAVRIRQIAEENDVPIVENPPLARALFATVELDNEIPPEHYKAVAEVISYVMRLKGKDPH
jgi:flagellar biosynthetic protein FlhB